MSNSKYFVSTSLHTDLPLWFKNALGKKKVINIIEIHFVPDDTGYEGNELRAKIMNKEIRTVSVHCPDLALMNSDYINNNNPLDHTFICYTNERVHKQIDLSTNLEFLNFQLYDDLNKILIPEDKIRLLRIELFLELFSI